jgi:hypothetical protein
MNNREPRTKNESGANSSVLRSRFSVFGYLPPGNADRKPGLLLAVCFLLSCAVGCGGSDYPSQVEKTRQRMALVDGENALLEEPISLPEGRTPVYFRPPRGVAVRPSEKSHPTSDWLFHLPWSEGRSLVPPLEAFVGATTKKPEEGLEELLHSRILEFLRQHADERLTARPVESPRDLIVTRQSDSPHERRPVRYRHFAYRSEHESPQWLAPDRPQLPERCIYHYDIYITDTVEFWGVVVFKSLNLEATLNAWRKTKVSPDMLMKLPQRSLLQVDSTRGVDAKETSLATLLIGARAKARLRLIGR